MHTMKTIIQSWSARRFVFALALTLSLASEVGAAPPCEDILFIGDNADHTVEMFDVSDLADVAHLGAVDKARGGKIRGPRGLVLDDGRLLVLSQNVNKNRPGELLVFDATTGEFIEKLIDFRDENAPFAPLGIVEYEGELFIASLIDESGGEGAVLRYDAVTGDFLGEFDTTGLMDELQPRGLVIGPDGYLYVANTNLPGSPVGGSVLRFDPDTYEFVNVVVADTCCAGVLELHRPEGLVFGPDGRLYVTTFRNDPATTVDGILVFEVRDGVGTLVDTIPLYELNQPRVFAQALLFGPADKLFVPISGPLDSPDSGSVRAHDVETKSYDVVIDDDELGAGWYLTFCETDPSTLAYEGD